MAKIQFPVLCNSCNFFKKTACLFVITRNVKGAKTFVNEASKLPTGARIRAPEILLKKKSVVWIDFLANSILHSILITSFLLSGEISLTNPPKGCFQE